MQLPQKDQTDITGEDVVEENYQEPRYLRQEVEQWVYVKTNYVHCVTHVHSSCEEMTCGLTQACRDLHVVMYCIDTGRYFVAQKSMEKRVVQ